MEQGTSDLSVFDGRYSQSVKDLQEYFSDYSFVRNRVKLELYWLKFCIENVKDLGSISKSDVKRSKNILKICEDFSYFSYKTIKEYMKETGNEFDAIEKYIAQELKSRKMSNIVGLEEMHCSIQDIDETAYAMMIKDALNMAWISAAEKLVRVVENVTLDEEMYTLNEQERFETISKELKRYASRLRKAITRVREEEIGVKDGVVLDTNSPMLSKKFIEDWLGLSLSEWDYMDYISNDIKQFNKILLQLNNDLVGLDHFKSPIPEDEKLRNSLRNSTYESSDTDINVSNSLFTILARQEDNHMHITKNMVLAFGFSMQAMERTMIEVMRLNKAN